MITPQMRADQILLLTKMVGSCLPVIASAFVLFFGCFISPPVAIAEENKPFFQTLEAYKPVYMLHSWFLDEEGKAVGYKDRELLIQFSFKKKIFKVLYFGYTQRMFWQIFDLGNSRPFREQNYNPEAFIEFEDLWGIDIFRLGLAEHESNGEKERYNEDGEAINYSRTWDRSYLYLWKDMGEYLGMGIKAWVVTSQKTDEFGAYYTDNPDLQDYMGSGELYASFGQFPTVLTIMYRRGWLENTDTYRIEGRLPIYHLLGKQDSGYDLYFSYFNGYGDSLTDYNRKISRFALGISVH